MNILDVEERIMKLDRTAACIAAFEGITDIKLITEKDNVLSMPSMKIAVHCCFAVYYIFNLTYPTAIAPPFLLLLEHISIWDTNFIKTSIMCKHTY